MANQSAAERRTLRPVTPTEPRPDARADRPAEAAPKKPKLSRANEIVRAIGLRPIRGLSGPKIGY